MQTIPAPRPFALDPARIAATSGAIAVNAALLLLLIAPMAAPVVEAMRTPQPIIDFIPIHRDPPPPPPPPIRVEVRHTATPTPSPPTQVTRIEAPQPPLADSTEPGDYVVTPAETVTEPGPVVPPDDGQPLTGAHLEYASAPAPIYPRESLLDNETGVVMLEVLVDVDGRPIDVKVSRSSGHRRLDLAAKRQVLAKWRFKPAMRNGQPVQAIGLVPVEFALD